MGGPAELQWGAMLSEERLKAWRLGRKLTRSRRRIKFIGYMRLTGRKIVYERVNHEDQGAR